MLRFLMVEGDMEDAGAPVAEVDAGSLELGQEFGVEGLAVEAELLESGAAVAPFITEGGKHAGGSAAGLARKLPSLNQGDAVAGAAEVVGDRAADGAATDDDCVRHAS